MRVSTILLALPALAAAQQQAPLLDQVKGWFAKASASIASAMPSAPTSVAVPNPVASGAAKIAEINVDRLTLDNHERLIRSRGSTAASGTEEWMIFVTGGNKTCYGACEHAERSWNASVALIAASSKNQPHLAVLDCETDGVLCNAWAASPPRVLHFLLPHPLADQSTPASTVRYVNVNRTSVTASEIAGIHLQEQYKDTEPYDGIFHPFDGPLARAGLNIPAGWAIWGFAQIPSWAFMIVISMMSRTFMGRRMPQAGANQGGAGAQPAAQ